MLARRLQVPDDSRRTSAYGPPMGGYVVGIDLGTTFTAASVLRDGEHAETVQLGNRGAAIPTVVFLRDDDTILTGHAALRRGLSEPGRLAREFKRRFGDPTPLLLGGVPISADALTGRMLRSTLDAVVEREGSAPTAVAVCHPANWGPYKLDLLAQACRHAGLDHAVLISEPEAAAVHYAAQERIDAGARVAVYDLGGGTFDAAVLRRTEDGFEVVGTPDGIERLGGIDIDEAVVGRVRDAVGPAIDDVDLADPATVSALARLREECVEAKEALSGDTDTTVPVVLPGLSTEVRITRVELESMIRVPIAETIDALRRALHGAEVDPEDLAAVLLVGGSSRIPMVAEMVGAELGRPVAVDADPKHVVALGAAAVAARSLVAAAPVLPPPPAAPPATAP
jgi:molecular chaperone DnaK (HSP70)